MAVGAVSLAAPRPAYAPRHCPAPRPLNLPRYRLAPWPAPDAMFCRCRVWAATHSSSSGADVSQKPPLARGRMRSAHCNSELFGARSNERFASKRCQALPAMLHSGARAERATRAGPWHRMGTQIAFVGSECRDARERGFVPCRQVLTPATVEGSPINEQTTTTNKHRTNREHHRKRKIGHDTSLLQRDVRVRRSGYNWRICGRFFGLRPAARALPGVFRLDVRAKRAANQ